MSRDVKDKKWETVQIKAFTSWVNGSFDKNNIEPVKDLARDMADGVKLPQFLECITGKALKYDKKPHSRINIIQNLGISLKVINEDLGVKLVAIGAEDIADGQLKLILGMLWSMFRRLKLSVIEVDGEKSELGLLSWIRTMTEGYDGVNITTFKDSFNDGFAFSALIHKFDNSLLDYNECKKDAPGDNLRRAFEVAERELAIPALLEVDDMLSGAPDERSVILYASLFFHAYLSKQDKDKMMAQQNETKDKLTNLESQLASLQEEREELLRNRKTQGDRITELEQTVADRDSRIDELLERIKALEAELEYLREKALRDAEALALMEQKINLLTDLLEAEKTDKDNLEGSRDRFKNELENMRKIRDAMTNQNLSLEEQKKKLLTDNEEKERALADAEARKKSLLGELEDLRAQVQREIERRRQKAKELLELQRENERLRQREINQGRARVGLDVLKRNLEEHLEDLSRWKELHQQDLEEKPDFDLGKVLGDISKKSFEEQLKYLDGRLQEENRSLLRIIRLKDSKMELEDTILKEGWLLMKGRKEWKRRFFRLRGSRLLYYEDDEVNISKYDGCVDLSEGCEIVRQKAIKGEEDNKKQWPLKITVGEKKLFIRAASKKERHSWFFWISSRIIHLNYLKEVSAAQARVDTRLVNLIAMEEVPNLYLDHKKFSSEGIVALTKALIAHDEIDAMSISSAELSDEHMGLIADVLGKLSVKTLLLDNNCITSAGVGHITKNTENQLTGLSLAHNKVDDAGLASIVSSYVSSGRLEMLNLAGNSFSSVKGLADALAAAGHVPATISLEGCGLGDDAASDLAAVVKANKGIKKLSLKGNKLTDSGAKVLADAVAGNTTLVELDLSGNAIGNDGVAALCKALEGNETLMEVNLGANKNVAGGQGLSALGGDVYGFPVLVCQRTKPQ
mmetsp:Transcript_52280/g.131261  ORF Transcript_52280/g.131261 Transcript_52280/m.131261 type:complete len:917 (-) Transcript_52280:79-2829(-)|eukprot:CAMPEP_0177662736 /NCGR_PEP_ID=MMETSP0447-20121125/19480_1 /TAXON_ID=0 /ORGANISM="Stygamoeba regulata, Strain BSH-02190019" /LENGTH=916 /DNA_ID=CAMNT_0019168383 /DNA_START=22 /DNA_END=2772 /DNA_ORIENTATION=-